MHALYVLWWVQERRVPVAAVAAILAAGDLAISALELPTGWVADRYGHRVSLITGSLLQIAGMLFAWHGRGIPGVLASSVLIAAGDAFRSGADQALLFRSCIAAGDGAFQRREARARAAQLAALVLLVLAGGAIVGAWGFHAGWFAETALSIAGLAIALAMVEPPEADAPADVDATLSTAGAPWPRGPEPARQLAALVGVIMPAALVIAATSGALFIVQSTTGTGTIGVTVLVAAATLAEASGAFAAARVAPRLAIQIAIAAGGIAVLATSIVMPRLFPAEVLGACFLTGLVEPLRAAAIQRIAADRVRARAASLASACDKLLTMIALLAVGILPRGRARR
jgi:hypothetical protein